MFGDPKANMVEFQILDPEKTAKRALKRSKMTFSKNKKMYIQILSRLVLIPFFMVLAKKLHLAH